MLKSSEITDELKQEIIEYAKQTSHYQAQKKYNVWGDTIKYWIDPNCRDKIKQKQRNYHNTMMETSAEYREKRRQKTENLRKTEENKKYMQQYIETNKERILHNIKKHRQNNLEHYKDQAYNRYITTEKQKMRERYNTDPVFKLKCNIRESVRRALKYGEISKSHPSIKYLGCTVDEFKLFIEKQFKPGMTWDNHGRGEKCWHLDHKIPLTILDINDSNTLMKLCHYSNYQPLWEQENLEKQDKVSPEDMEEFNSRQII